MAEATFYHWAGGVEAVLAVLLALALAAFGVRRPSTWVLVALMVDYAVVALARALPPLLVDWGAIEAYEFFPRQAVLAFVIAKALLVAFNLAFVATYPEWSLGPGRIMLLVASLAFGGGLASIASAVPALSAPADGGVTWFQQLVAFFVLASALPALWVFGTYWVKSKPGLFRNQFLYVLVFYLWWNLNGSISFIVRSGANPDRAGVFLPLVILLAVAQVALILRILIRAMARATRAETSTLAGGHRHADLKLVIWLVLAIPAVLLQFVARGGEEFVAGLVVPVLAYGIARTQMIRVELTIHRGIRGGIVTAGMVLALVAAEEVLELTIGNLIPVENWEFGVGLVVAVLVGITFTPLHRLATGSARIFMPNAQASGQHLDGRRVEIYRTALEGILRDQVLDAREARALGSLRRQLGVTQQQHDALERKLRGLDGPKVRRAVAVRV